MSKIWSNEIGQEQLFVNYKNEFSEQQIINSLENTFNSQNNEGIEAIFHIAFTFNLFSIKSTAILGKLILQPWHNQHENIASVFQDLKDPNSIAFIIKAVHINCDYWIDNGDAFIRKCLYAMAAINTNESKLEIAILANDSNEIVKKYALVQINKLDGK